MAKEALKTRARKNQNNYCKLSGLELPKETKLYDTHRPIPKAKGGTYDEHTPVVNSVAHMKEHNIFKIRDEIYENLKILIDDRMQIIKLKNKINNQLLANQRNTDRLTKETIGFLKGQLTEIKKYLKVVDKNTKKVVRELSKHDAFVKAALGVDSIGEITIAFCLIYIDLEKARHASSLWAYAGLDKPSYKRFEKGIAGGGNKTLRSALYCMAESQIKGDGPYRIVYDRVKERLARSEGMVESYTTQGKRETMMWKDTKPSHRHGAALRAIMKHFLADYWYVGRTLMGLDTNPLYAEAILKSGHRTIMPEERGWVY